MHVLQEQGGRTAYHVLLRPVRPSPRDSDTFSTCTDAFPSLPAPAFNSTISLAIRLACQHMLAPVTHDDALDVTDGHCLLSFLKLYIFLLHIIEKSIIAYILFSPIDKSI